MDKIQKFLGKIDISISEAMQKINNNSKGILFIINEDGILMGSLSDGDIRRFLLSDGKLSDRVEGALNHKPRVAKSKELAQRLYHKEYFKVIPIVNDDNHVVDLYFGENTSTEKKKYNINIPIVINAGGKGTRLDPFTRVLPKPLIPIGDIPIIERIMKEYQSFGCNIFHIIVNYKKDLIKAFFKDGENDYHISWYDEEKPLGTGGGLSLLKKQLEETFVFANCDVLIMADYEEIYNYHKQNGNDITMICAKKDLKIPYGVVDVNVDGTIRNMQEKPTISFMTNTGVYIVEPNVIDDIEDGVFMDFPNIIQMEKEKGRKVAVFSIDESEWMDMGQLSELEKTKMRLSIE